MDMGRIVTTLLLFLGMSSNLVGAQMRLSYDYYSRSCPRLEQIVRTGLQSTFVDPTASAAMVRLMFHDCQVQGCDASILLEPENGIGRSEMAAAKNFGVRKRESIGRIKAMVESACPRQVSCADILILAAREAVATAGGPRIQVPLGRKDSTRPPSARIADASLPPADIGVDGTLRMFARDGMTTEEIVAILGGHTLGVTHCLNLRNRRSSIVGQGHGRATKPVQLNCPPPLGLALDNLTLVFNDPTSIIFDNSYFVNAMAGRGVLRIDAEMPLDPRTAPFVRRFAQDRDQFFRAFSSAFVKLASSGVLTGSQGVIRKTCDKLN